MTRTRRNPSKLDLYDPRDEQIRAQRQGIYESSVRKLAGVPYSTPFRDSNGRRLDVAYGLVGKGSTGIEKLQSKMFGIGTAVGQKHGRLKHGSQDPTGLAMVESMSRYADPDPLLRNRQDYEETLALFRKGDFYRVTPEVTSQGLRYFVWPLPFGRKLPVGFEGLTAARKRADQLNAEANPLVTGYWWKPPRQEYTLGELAFWLPPARAFAPTGRAPMKRPKTLKETGVKRKPQIPAQVMMGYQAFLQARNGKPQAPAIKEVFSMGTKALEKEKKKNPLAAFELRYRTSR